MTTYIFSGESPAAVRQTWFISGRPSRRCSTFARSDRIRVPSPAARINTSIGFRSVCVSVINKILPQITRYAERMYKYLLSLIFRAVFKYEAGEAYRIVPDLETGIEQRAVDYPGTGNVVFVDRPVNADLFRTFVDICGGLARTDGVAVDEDIVEFQLRRIFANYLDVPPGRHTVRFARLRHQIADHDLDRPRPGDGIAHAV